MKPTRRQVVQMLGVLGAIRVQTAAASTPPQLSLSAQDLKGALAIQGRDLNGSYADAVRQSLQRNLQQFQAVRDLEIADTVRPPLIFRSWSP